MGWNMKQAARECGVAPATWRTWERSGVSPHGLTDIAWRIAERTGADYGWLLAGPRLSRDTASAVATTERVRQDFPRVTVQTVKPRSVRTISTQPTVVVTEPDVRTVLNGAGMKRATGRRPVLALTGMTE
jgi:transcriptional regulator with XRE-family HTH domain